MIRGVHHVQLSVPAGSEPTLRAFYGGLLGMAEVAKPAALAARGGVWLRAGGSELHLGVEQGFRPARKAHPALLVDDLGALARSLVAAGCGVEWDGLLPGYRRCYVHDPCGNRLELLEPLSGPTRPGSPSLAAERPGRRRVTLANWRVRRPCTE